MNEQELNQLANALYRYFAHAQPDDDAHNAAISRSDRERYGARMLFLGPAVIVTELHDVVMHQTMTSRDDATADRQLRSVGLHLLFCYRSLVKAYGANGVIPLTARLLLPDTDEDIVAIIACALGLLVEDELLMTKMSLQAAAQPLQDEINDRDGTACKVALAWALLRCGVKDPFRRHAIPALALVTSESHSSLERLINSRQRQEQRYLDSLVLNTILLNVASEGRAHYGWWRRGQ